MPRNPSMQVAILASLVVALSVFQPAMAESAVPRIMRMAMTIDNPSGDQVKNGSLKVYGPLAAKDGRWSVDTKATTDFRESVDALGNRAVEVSGVTVPPYAQQRIILTFAITAREVNHDDTATLPQFLQSAPGIESDALDIRQQARTLWDAGPPTDFPVRAHAWVAEHVRYSGYTAEDRGALFALREAQGDCTEYATLFVALMRAAGVPARVMGGWVMETSGIAKAADFHNWAEYFSDGRWHVADPQRRVLAPVNGAYIATRIVTRIRQDESFAYRHELAPQSLRARWD